MTTDHQLAGEPLPLHRRSIDYEAFDFGDALLVVGKLQDTRPWAEEGHAVAMVHDMALRVTVRITDMTITEATAEMHTFPHSECPAIVQAFSGLTGLSVARGYSREVQSRFGGPRGCTHLEQLARSLGPVVIQAVTSRRALAVSRGESDDLLSGPGSPWARDSCHVWAEGGVADQKLAAGWRPGTGPYPSLPVEDIRRAGAAP
ncbi:MAG TPA: DUF2889 domain-containing protein [Acidimicrobiales bacterium]|nr:DUF2889 domain-containing protein [Acidimicrobiales bacterium]